MNLIAKSEKDLPNIASTLLETYPDSRIFGFFGDMGVGKTTFIKVLCQQLGAHDVTSSPTFSIINEYLTDKKEPIFHFDFYRINELKEAMEIGFEDYLYSGAYCFIEWTEKIEELLPYEYVKVIIETDVHFNRIFTVSEEKRV